MDVETPFLDGDGRHVVRPAPILEFDHDDGGEIDRLYPPEPGESIRCPMRTSVAGLVVLASDENWTGVDSPGRRAAGLLPFVDDTSEMAERVDALRVIMDLAKNVPVRFVPEWHERAFNAVLSPTGLRARRPLS